MGKRRRLLSFYFVALIFLIFVIFPGLAALFISPVAGFFTRIGTGIYNSTYWFNNSQEITPSELKEISETLEHLALDRVEFERLKKENNELKQMVGFIERTESPFVSAKILAKSLENTVSRFVVNAGSVQGVKINDPVVADQGVLVGKVVKVTSNSSTVVTISDPDHATAVSLVNEHQTIGIARGTQSGLLSISFIPLDESISINDIVVTSGLEASVPSGLIVGIVNAVEQDEASLFKSAVVEPLIDMRLLSSVIILTQEIL
jgi:rod shape-determining protein MreC